MALTRIGVVSDTHGLYEPKLAALFEGVSLILHGGDIGKGVLAQLQALAPVRAVAGNNDVGDDAQLPAARVERVGQVPILVVHDLGSPAQPPLRVTFLMEAEQPRVVVSGHSHKGLLRVEGGVLFVNPGGAGKKRFKLPRTAAVLEVSDTQVLARLHALEGEGVKVLQELAVAL
jgi:putative phosphoesterase